jgi:hypothetical protein
MSEDAILGSMPFAFAMPYLPPNQGIQTDGASRRR